MKIDSGIGDRLADAGPRAARLEALGFDGGISAEVSHDPFLPLAVAADHTERLELLTSIAVAFSRSPMTLANIGHDLHEQSGGRFLLGLGSQIRPHITKRFSMPWSRPAARMRELIAAVHAIWDAWDLGTPLDFRGDFYTHTLMTPMFQPEPSTTGRPPILLAGVGPEMTRVAAEAADGFIAHAFTTAEYFRATTLPIIERGLDTAGRDRSTFQISMPVFMADLDERADPTPRIQALRGQIAFYGSTPAYRPVLEHHGWGDLQTELNRLSKAGRWADMGEAIDDDVLHAFAVVAPAEELPDLLAERYGGTLDRILLTAPTADMDRWSPILDRIRAL